jgi:hypothetical protein
MILCLLKNLCYYQIFTSIFESRQWKFTWFYACKILFHEIERHTGTIPVMFEVCAGKAATSLHMKILNLKRESSDNCSHKYTFILAVMLVAYKKTQMTAAGQLQHLHFSIVCAFFTIQPFISVISHFSQFYVHFWWALQNIFLFQVIFITVSVSGSEFFNLFQLTTHQKRH